MRMPTSTAPVLRQVPPSARRLSAAPLASQVRASYFGDAGTPSGCNTGYDPCGCNNYYICCPSGQCGGCDVNGWPYCTGGK